ncbi:YceI family protein [Crenobacter caeni]|uniref:YceI family protein n=1 Tax=Crenobacter caeni TaxID=2705474 RepID=A0A6B2KRN4_9NEIS|nr:YceI family protein [Crenobacter caeni]NDV12597.1 YceI family protein [Crenobacter caeni]
MTVLKPTLAAILMSAAFGAIAAPVTYTIDPTHTTATYSVNHLGLSLQQGTFSEVSGRLVVDEAAGTGKVEVVVPTASLNSHFAKRDEHLKGPDFFDVARYPEMRFAADKVVFRQGKPERVEGQLTLRGVTRPLTLTVTRAARLANPMSGVETWGVNAEGRLKRSEFGMDKYLPGVGDEVTLAIALEAPKAQ